MPFVQRVIEPKYLSRSGGPPADADGGGAAPRPLLADDELEAVTNSTLSNALRQLASLVLAADDIFADLGHHLHQIRRRSDTLKARIVTVEQKVVAFDPKKVAVPESDIGSFAQLKKHYETKHEYETNLFSVATRPKVVRELYEAAARTPIHVMRQLDRWRRDGHRSSRFFMCTPVLGAKRRRIRNRVDIDIETRMPAVVEELRRWTSSEALGDVTVTADGQKRFLCNTTVATDGDLTDGTIVSDDEVDHKLPSPEEQLQVVALKFPAEVVAMDVSGKNFDRMCAQRRSLLHGELASPTEDGSTARRKTRSRKPRNRRRNTLAGTDQKEIQDALTAGEDESSAVKAEEPEEPVAVSGGAVARSKSSDLLRSSASKKESPDNKKSHFNSLKEWGRNRLKAIASMTDSKSNDNSDEVNIYETVTTVKRRRNVEKERKSLHERKPSCSSSEKSSVNVASGVNNVVRLRDSSAQRRLRRAGENKDEPHSSSGNWSASSESGRASIGSEITSTTTQPKSSTSATTSNNSLNLHAPSSASSRRRFNINTSTSGSATSEGTLTPDIINDLHEDGETSSVYSCDTEGYYTSFHMDSGLKTLKEEDAPATPMHSTTTFSSSSNTAENEYELFGKGSTSTTTSSAGTVCTTLRAAESNRSLVIGPAVPERISSLSKLQSKEHKSPESSLERNYDNNSDKTGTVKRSPANHKATIVAVIHKSTDGDVSPDSGHNTSSSPIESISSPNGVRSGSEFEFSESSDMEGADRIERIRIKTTINSSRIPSMCVITPSQSDDESIKSSEDNNKVNYFGCKNDTKAKLDLPIKPSENNNNNLNKVINTMQIINVNPQTGYATIETSQKSSHRAPSPSGGSVTVKEPTPTKSPPLQPMLKATLMPLNNMLGKLKLNFGRKPAIKTGDDSGEYVTIADVKNNNEKADVLYANDVSTNLRTVLSGKIRETEYVSLDELPCNDPENQVCASSADSLERRRKGARVTLDSEGKVVYSSDSLKRRKGAHTTFEPGPCVKPQLLTPTHSPLPSHRTPKTIRPAGQQHQQQPFTDGSRPLSPQLGKVVIKASSGTSEIVRMPPSTIVSPTSTLKPTNNARGAYVHMQAPREEEGRAHSPSSQQPSNYNPVTMPVEAKQIYGYHNPMMDSNLLSREFERNCSMKRGAHAYSTLPSRKTQYDAYPERSVTPDITRGLNPRPFSTNSMDRKQLRNETNEYRQSYFSNQPLHQNLGIPVDMPQVGQIYANQNNSPFRLQQTESESFRISPIDPRNHVGGFQSSTPSKPLESKAAVNLENRLLSPKKSTMSNEELYAAIHKSKKKLNIKTDDYDQTVVDSIPATPEQNKGAKPVETGYLGDKSKTRLSWSPNSGDCVDFNTTITPNINESRTRQSWACADKKEPQTSRLDFKRLLLLHGKTKIAGTTSKKLSAVEQLKLSKQDMEVRAASPPPTQDNVSILDLSASPRNLKARKNPSSPSRNPEKSTRPVPKLLSPRSQWRFANPRSDVLSSTILEDCHEDESPNSSAERKAKTGTERSMIRSIKQAFETKAPPAPQLTATQRLQAQRAQFFNVTPIAPKEQPASPPTLETSF